MPGQGLDLLRLPLGLLVAVAQTASVAIAPAPNGAIGGEGEAVVRSSQHAHCALTEE